MQTENSKSSHEDSQVTAEELRKIAIFFFLTLLDDRKIILASSQSSLRLQDLLVHSEKKDRDVLLVQACMQIYNRISNKKLRKDEGLLDANHFLLPDTLDLSAWRELQVTLIEKDLIVIVFCAILKLPVKAVAQGLVLSEGTIQLRLAKGLQILGRL